MDRRKSIQALIIGSVASGALIEACKLQEKRRSKKRPTPQHLRMARLSTGSTA